MKVFTTHLHRCLNLNFLLLLAGVLPLWSQVAYVTNLGSNNVSVINTATNMIVTTIPVGSGPVAVAITPDGARAYVVNVFSSNVSVINTATNTVLTTIPVGFQPFGIAITPDGTRAYVANQGSDNVSVINTVTNTVVGSPIPVGDEPLAVAITPDGTRAYVTNGVSNNVSVINTATNTVVATIPVGDTPFAIAITPDGARAYVVNRFSNNVTVINTATNTVVGPPIPVGDGPNGVAITPDGTRAYVTNRFSNNVSVINTATNAIMTTIPVVDGPFGIAITPDGARAYVANLLSNNVTVINTATNTVLGPPIPVGPSPIGIAITPAPPVPPSISKAFSPSTIPVGGTSALTFTIANRNTAAPATGVGFFDPLPFGVFVAFPNGLTGSCGGGLIVAAPGATVIALGGTTLAPGASCTFSVNVTASAAGARNNVAGPVTSLNQGIGNTASATLLVTASVPLLPPVLTKAFGAPTVLLNETTTLSFSLSNPNATPLTGLTFTDSLPLGLQVAAPNGLTGSCGGGTITALPGSGAISLAGATLAGGASCSFAVNVTGIGLGVQTNTTGTVLSTQAPPGSPATAIIAVIADPFRVNYFSNLNVGDSVVNITNSGALGAGLRAGTSAGITGAICANVYVFSPDEQLISCCSCPVTPNGLVSLSVRNDLISNPLTPAVPTSVVVKLLATVPVAGTCSNSAAGVTSATLAPGIAAWGTTLHASPGGGFALTERAFVNATLSDGQLNRLGNLCNFILANGSGFGVCRSCRLGGLGGDRR